MPIYTYICEKGKHTIEKIVKMDDRDTPQLCEEHNEQCTRKEFEVPGNFIWGVNEISWTAGLASDPHGMGKYKKK